MSYHLRPTPQPLQGGRYDGYDYNCGYGHSHSQEQGYSQPQQQRGMMHAQPQPPPPPRPTPLPPLPVATTMYQNDGFARTHTWVANQPPITSPPPPSKTPFTEWTGPYSDVTFDRRTFGENSGLVLTRAGKDSGRICGSKRTAFFIALAIELFLLVVAIAVGLGVGLARERTTMSSRRRRLVLGPVICPQDNNTVYVSRGSSKPFNVQCGRDYNSANGARDIGHMSKPTMAQCIDECGRHDDCVGVGYGYYQGSFECWMKSELGEPNWSSQWYFAQLQDIPQP
ncbi:hypothetical protein AAE478_003984 [Parahypoxylon ruwenzoriense]